MFGNKILDFKDELLKDLNTLLSFESVDGEKNDECDNALNFILKRAEDFGLTGERTTDKSGHITLGNSGKLCGVLTHLDVVPAGNAVCAYRKGRQTLWQRNCRRQGCGSCYSLLFESNQGQRCKGREHSACYLRHG